MKSKAIIPLVVGLAVGLVAIKFTMDTVRKAQGSGNKSELVTVVMARQDIPSTAAIEPEFLVLAQTPRTPLLPVDTFTKLEDLKGRVALKSIPQGSPVLPSMVAPQGTMPGLIVRVKEGFRAVAVKIDESSGVGYLVKPNDWVDVLAVMEINRHGKTETVSQLVLERVQVGAVGQVLDDAPKDAKSAENTRVQTVTLLVKVADVPKLHLAQTRGKITLAMRGTEDEQLTHKTFSEEEEREKVSATKSETKAAAAGAFSELWRKAAEAPQPAPATQAGTPPAPAAKTFTVTVVNGSASSKAEPKVDHVTYRDANSMNTVDDGSSPSNIAPPPAAPAWQPPQKGDTSKVKPYDPDFPDDPGDNEVKDDEPQRQG